MQPPNTTDPPRAYFLPRRVLQPSTGKVSSLQQALRRGADPLLDLEVEDERGEFQPYIPRKPEKNP